MIIALGLVPRAKVCEANLNLPQPLFFANGALVFQPSGHSVFDHCLDGPPKENDLLAVQNGEATGNFSERKVALSFASFRLLSIFAFFPLVLEALPPEASSSAVSCLILSSPQTIIS